MEERELLRAENDSLRRRLADLEAGGTTVRDVAHDLNNVLAALLGGLSLLELELDQDAVRGQDIKELKELVGQGATLARKILEFARAASQAGQATGASGPPRR